MAVTMGETAADYLNVQMGFGLTATSLIMSAVLAACRTESFQILGIVENGRFRLPWRFDLAALAPVDPATGLYL